MDILDSIILGVVQGLTEWLPVSSSGHLVLTNEWLGLSSPVAFSVMLHFATVLVIVIMFRQNIKDIINGVLNPKPVKGGSVKKMGKTSSSEEKTLAELLSKGSYWQRVRGDPNALFGWFIVLGSMPIAFIGLIFYDAFTSFFDSLLIVSIALVGTGIVLGLSAAAFKAGHKKKMTALDAYTIGIGQGLALVPGLSRSGLTIGLGLMRNVERETVARYSILLAVPAIIGATLWELPSLFSGTEADVSLIALLVGGLTAFVVGYTAIKLLLLLVRKAGIHYFALYCFALAGIIMVTL